MAHEETEWENALGHEINVCKSITVWRWAEILGKNVRTDDLFTILTFEQLQRVEKCISLYNVNKAVYGKNNLKIIIILFIFEFYSKQLKKNICVFNKKNKKGECDAVAVELQFMICMTYFFNSIVIAIVATTSIFKRFQQQSAIFNCLRFHRIYLKTNKCAIRRRRKTKTIKKRIICWTEINMSNVNNMIPLSSGWKTTRKNDIDDNIN